MPESVNLSNPSAEVLQTFKKWENAWRETLVRWQKQYNIESGRLAAMERSRTKSADEMLSKQIAAKKQRLEHYNTNIKFIERIIYGLNKAAHTGNWQHDKFDMGVFKEPKWIAQRLTNLPRGWQFNVLERKGDWFNINVGAITGWANMVYIRPNPPAEFWNVKQSPHSSYDGSSYEEELLAGRG